MPFPIIGGTITNRYTSTDVAIDISAIPTGGWMVMSVMVGVTGTSVTPPGGWSTLRGPETTGTRRNYLFGKLKDGADGSQVHFTQSGASAAAYSLLWGTNGAEVASWTIGLTGTRAASGEPSGSRYTNIAPSITTTTADNLAITISNEATLAMTQPYEITSYTAGWTERIWLAQVAANVSIETTWMGTKQMATAGATGSVSVVYTSPQDNNGWALQIAIPYAAPVTVTTPQIVGTAATYSASGVTTSFTINRPSGLANNDYVVVALRSQSSSTTSDPSSTGFTRLGPAFVPSNMGGRVVGFYGKPITDAVNEPSNYTFTMSTSGGSARVEAVAFIVRGVDLTNPVSGYFNSYEGTSVSGGKQVDSYAITKIPVLAVFLGASEFSSPNNHIPTSYPSGYTEQYSLVTSTDLGVSRTFLWIGTKEYQSGSSVGASTITWGVPAGPAAEGIAFNGVTSTPTDPAGVGFNSRNGNGQAVKVYYTTANGPKTPSNMVPMRPGFSSVSAMLAKPGFTWAHRGGSASYPEHSLYAYTQAVARGYGVLEVSLARTSDGVWFGLHDQTTDRSSGGTYGNASSQTWAQIQAQQIVIGAQGAPQPYMSLNQLVAIYGNTHIFVLDPKYALGTYRTEFLNMVNTLLGPTKAIIKYSGPGSGAAGLSTAAQAMGYETWGFFYASDASAAQGGSGALQTWGPSWTILGMEYGASQAIWDECKALNKPIVGHIAPNQAAYDMAIAKGASGVQVSGVGVVAPVSWWT